MPVGDGPYCNCCGESQKNGDKHDKECIHAEDMVIINLKKCICKGFYKPIDCPVHGSR